MQEKLRLDILTRLAIHFNNDQLKIIDEVLTNNLCKYEFKEICTDIAVYQDGLPNEIKQFLVCKSIKGLTESSLKHYKRILTHFANNISKDIKEVTTNDIRFYLINYEKTHNTGKSAIDDKRRILNSFFVWMMREDIITKNPMDKIDAIKCDKKVRQPLTALELEQMRSACETLREKALLELLYSTGCRVSEIISLNKSDINYDTGTLKVFGKGKKERYVFINAKAQLSIKKYIFSRNDNEEALFVQGKYPYSRLGKSTIEKEIKEIGKRAKINRNVFPHLIRHTFATHMLSHGANLSEVQILLGHESPSTTMIYAKTNMDNLHNVHKKCII